MCDSILYIIIGLTGHIMTPTCHPLGVIKLGFWNINGYNRKVIGNKLINRDFMEKVENCNIIGLA